MYAIGFKASNHLKPVAALIQKIVKKRKRRA